jgi:hypothetical protein
MFGTRMIGIASAVVLTLGGARAAVAQAEINALVYWDVQSSDRLAQGCRVLGYTLFETASEGPFIAQLQSQSWDFVGIELPQDSITQKALVAQLLEDHVATGGALIVNYNHLNEWPRLQRLLGVAATSPVPPMLDVLSTDPPHCVWGGGTGRMNHAFVGQPSDPGDVLVPVATSSVVGEFSNGANAMLLSASGKIIVNGFDFGSVSGASGVARRQVAYVVECRADFDRSTGRGVLDIFDFLAFQNSFVRGNSCANMVFDMSYDIFDFLAFQDVFVRGCQ